MDHFAKRCPCSCWPRRAPETLFITYLGVPIWLKALIFFTCKSLLKEVGLAAGEMALKSVFKDLGPKECETSVEHGAAGRQQVPRCLYPAAAAGPCGRTWARPASSGRRTHHGGCGTAPRARGTSGHARLRQEAQLMIECWLNGLGQERKQPKGEKWSKLRRRASTGLEITGLLPCPPLKIPWEKVKDLGSL